MVDHKLSRSAASCVYLCSLSCHQHSGVRTGSTQFHHSEFDRIRRMADANSDPPVTKFFSLTEVEEHKVARGTDKSVWLVIHDKVYDVTKFLDEVFTF